MNSCIMLAVSLHTPTDLDSIIDNSDLRDDGLVKDSHITILFDKVKEIPRDEVLPSISEILGDEDYLVFLEVLKDNNKFKLTDIFELSTFDNGDSDYLIMRLKPNNEMYQVLSKLNSGLIKKYGTESDFTTYKPHMTLAKMIPGTASKYLNNKKLEVVLKDSKVGFEDIIISYGHDEGKDDKYNITTFHAIERLFRE